MRLRVSSEIRIGDEADDEVLDERARTAVAWLFKARSSPHPAHPPPNACLVASIHADGA
jgi:hypothetical protein